ncbi:e3 ubiquitin-protein ligase csu1 [Quercus suber]|uniref:E3 ubiquitin-protein ligase csu1 n=1 Tax=Quercus suber TaxID=58331 RepID=A0AAW0LMS4_QUESU
MPQRHSKNNNDLAFFTYDEKRKLGYGTQSERLGKDSIKPFDACSLCLKPFIDPLCCQKGHVFCKECILECLLSQKKDIQRIGKITEAKIFYFLYWPLSFMDMKIVLGSRIV